MDFDQELNDTKTGARKSGIEGISIEAFRGDFEELERMAHASWKDEYGQASFPNFYRPDFLRFIFSRVPDKDFLIAAYKGNEIVGFLANLPRKFQFKEKVYRGVYSCLLVVRRSFLRKGLATALIEEALRLNLKARYDFALLTLEKGHRSSLMVQKLKDSGHPVEWVRRNYVIARILDLQRASLSEGLKGWEKAAVRLIGGNRRPRRRSMLSLKEYRKENLDDCFRLLESYRRNVPLCLIWDPNDLAAELACPGVSETLVYEDKGKVRAMINYIAHDHLGQTTERWAWINHVAFPDLNSAEKRAFVEGFLSKIKEKGYIGTVEWTRHYYSLKPFYRAGFFPYFRYVNLLSWTFNSSLSLAKLPGVYEVQI